MTEMILTREQELQDLPIWRYVTKGERPHPERPRSAILAANACVSVPLFSRAVISVHIAQYAIPIKGFAGKMYIPPPFMRTTQLF
jgi:hypothetical protein